MTVGLFGLLVALWSRGHFSPVQFGVVLIFALQLVFSIGLGWVLAALTVFFRDIAQILNVLVLFLMLFSPIGYTADMIPKAMLPIMQFNPLFYLIELYRSTLIDNVMPWRTLFLFGASSFVLFAVGHTVFMRLKPVFAEYV